MVRRDILLASQDAARESVAHDPASVPNLCDSAGLGLDLLCGAKARQSGCRKGGK